MRLDDAEDKLDILMITEVKPKSARYKLIERELKLRGYDMYSNPELDTGRGKVIYSKKNLQQEYQFLHRQRHTHTHTHTHTLNSL